MVERLLWFADRFPDKEVACQYLEKVETDGAWFGEMELTACAQVYQCNIIAWKYSLDTHAGEGRSVDQIHRFWGGNDSTAKVVHVLWENSTHWEELIPVRRGNRLLARQDAALQANASQQRNARPPGDDEGWTRPRRVLSKRKAAERAKADVRYTQAEMPQDVRADADRTCLEEAGAEGCLEAETVPCTIEAAQDENRQVERRQNCTRKNGRRQKGKRQKADREGRTNYPTHKPDVGAGVCKAPESKQARSIRAVFEEGNVEQAKGLIDTAGREVVQLERAVLVLTGYSKAVFMEGWDSGILGQNDLWRVAFLTKKFVRFQDLNDARVAADLIALHTDSQAILHFHRALYVGAKDVLRPCWENLKNSMVKGSKSGPCIGEQIRRTVCSLRKGGRVQSLRRLLAAAKKKASARTANLVGGLQCQEHAREARIRTRKVLDRNGHSVYLAREPRRMPRPMQGKASQVPGARSRSWVQRALRCPESMPDPNAEGSENAESSSIEADGGELRERKRRKTTRVARHLARSFVELEAGQSQEGSDDTTESTEQSGIESSDEARKSEEADGSGASDSSEASGAEDGGDTEQESTSKVGEETEGDGNDESKGEDGEESEGDKDGDAESKENGSGEETEAEPEGDPSEDADSDEDDDEALFKVFHVLAAEDCGYLSEWRRALRSRCHNYPRNLLDFRDQRLHSMQQPRPVVTVRNGRKADVTIAPPMRAVACRRPRVCPTLWLLQCTREQSRL